MAYAYWKHEIDFITRLFLDIPIAPCRIFSMGDYYSEKLSADRLRRCYELAPERIEQYFKAELDFALSFAQSKDEVLDLGCGYGRTLPATAARAGWVAGIDSSIANLRMAARKTQTLTNVHLACMDASSLGLADNSFNLVLCIQNGISAFHVDPRTLIRESLRVTKPGGTALFSTYSKNIWEARLRWFQLQAEAGLLGEINYEKTGDGEIVCKDGFTATTFTEQQFENLTDEIDAKVELNEIDQSSLFCIIRKKGRG